VTLSGTLLQPLGFGGETFEPLAADDFCSKIAVWNEEEERRLPVVLKGIRWLVSVPLCAHDELLGCLVAAVEEKPTTGDVQALAMAALQGAAALENVSRLEALSRELEVLRHRYPSVE
jgi:hypothetical protein